jgi:integrase
VDALVARFEAKVDRSGEHHLWTGARSSAGTPQIRVNGKLTTARRVAWELAFDALAAEARVGACPAEVGCVRAAHLTLDEGAGRSGGHRRASGQGTKRQVRPGVWKLTVAAGRYEDGTPRRQNRTAYTGSSRQAERELAAFVAEVGESRQVHRKSDRDLTLDDAVERYIDEHLVQEKGREHRTVKNYRGVHRKWFAPSLGKKRVRDVTEEDIDRIFGRMRRAGTSASRMQDARNLYKPFFRWAKRRGIVRRNPMLEFELPTSKYVAKEYLPPEVEQLCQYLESAVRFVPDVAPILALAAVTGMRRGELVTIRRNQLLASDNRIRIGSASDGKGVKSTKTRKERNVSIDPASMQMLLRHCATVDEAAKAAGIKIADDAFVFSLDPKASTPMVADFVSKRVAVLKEHLGIANKRPETIALEDEALRLFRGSEPPRAAGATGPAPAGAMSYKEIGRRLNRSPRWAFGAVASAQRRETAPTRVGEDFFDGSTVALRKFTSSELLDAGFNISMVAERQGHSPQVLVKHYAKARRSADRKAATHLGLVVHGGAPQDPGAVDAAAS